MAVAVSPRPVAAQGRPDTAVIPPNWSDTHRPVVEKTMTGTCTIRRPGGTGKSFDPETRATTITPHAAHYEGPCRVQMLPLFGRASDAADQPVANQGYLVTITWDAAGDAVPLSVDDIVTVTAVEENGDPSLVDRTLIVGGITRGTLTWERDLLCTENLSVGRPTA